MERDDSSALLDHLLALSRLTLSEGEREEFARKFERLLSFVDAVNTSEHAAGIDRSSAAAGALSYLDSMPLADDEPRIFEWPDGTVHSYVVPRIVGGEADGGNGGGDSGASDCGRESAK